MDRTFVHKRLRGIFVIFDDEDLHLSAWYVHKDSNLGPVD